MRFPTLPRHPFLGLAICAMIGVAISDRAPLPISLTVILLYFVCGLLLTFRPTRIGVWLFVILTFFILHHVQNFESSGKQLSGRLTKLQVVTATGIVVSEPTEHVNGRGAHSGRFEMRLRSIELKNQTSKIPATVLVHWSGIPPAYGDLVSIIGSADNLSPPTNPGGFDYRAYQNRRDIFSEIMVRFPDDEKILAHGKGNPLIAISMRTRRWMQKKLTLDLHDSPVVSGLLQSMVLGLKNETPENIKTLFQRTGTMHLFVVNGLHIGMFAAFALFLLKPLGVRRRLLPFFIIPLLIFYAVVTGMSPGSIRATIMATILFGGLLVDRPALPLNSLATAAFVILAWNTNELFMPGFQFSFGVVLAIVLLASPLNRFFNRFFRPDPFLPRKLWSRRQIYTASGSRYVTALLAVSTAAWIGSLAFTAHYFHLISLTAILANLIIVPLAFLVLAHGLAAMLSGIFSNAICALFNNCNWLTAKVILVFIQFFALIPNGHLYVEWPSFHAKPDCSITVLDFGDGGGAHIRSGGRDWLIDCGSLRDYKNVLQPYLQMRGINRLDGLLLTHGDSAHVGAAASLLDDFSPQCIGASPLKSRSHILRAFEAAVRKRKIGLGIYERDDRIRISPLATLRVLYPPASLTAASRGDDKALVLMLECENARILFMSDSGYFTERWLLKHHADLRADILVKGRNNADISGTPDFLNAVEPFVIIATSADYPSGAQLPKSWSAEMRKRHIIPLRQDQFGAVRISIANGELTVRTFVGGHTFRKNIR